MQDYWELKSQNQVVLKYCICKIVSKQKKALVTGWNKHDDTDNIKLNLGGGGEVYSFTP